MGDVCALRGRDETGYCDGFSLIAPFFTDAAAAAAADADAKAAAHRWKTAQSGIRKSFCWIYSELVSVRKIRCPVHCLSCV